MCWKNIKKFRINYECVPANKFFYRVPINNLFCHFPIYNFFSLPNFFFFFFFFFFICGFSHDPKAIHLCPLRLIVTVAVVAAARKELPIPILVLGLEDGFVKRVLETLTRLRNGEDSLRNHPQPLLVRVLAEENRIRPDIPRLVQDPHYCCGHGLELLAKYGTHCFQEIASGDGFEAFVMWGNVLACQFVDKRVEGHRGRIVAAV